MFNNSFPDKSFMAQQLAAMLLEIEAVHFRSDEPYIFTSGLASPIPKENMHVPLDMHDYLLNEKRTL